MVTVSRMNEEDFGCIVSSDHGVYASLRAVEWAVSRGFSLAEIEAEDITCLWEFTSGSFTVPLTEQDDPFLSAIATGRREAECSQVVDYIADCAMEWLNENVAPDGASFGWHDCEFVLWADEDWQEW